MFQDRREVKFARLQVTGIMSAVLMFVLCTIGLATVQAASVSTTPRCLTADLSVTIKPVQSAMSNNYSSINFTNISPSTCHLYGFPGVSLRDTNGHIIGNQAQFISGGKASYVELAPGQTQSSILDILDVSAYSKSACKPVTATTIRIYPPNDYTAKSIKLAVTGCSAKQINKQKLWYMFVQPITS